MYRASAISWFDQPAAISWSTSSSRPVRSVMPAGASTTLIGTARRSVAHRVAPGAPPVHLRDERRGPQAHGGRPGGGEGRLGLGARAAVTKRGRGRAIPGVGSGIRPTDRLERGADRRPAGGVVARSERATSARQSAAIAGRGWAPTRRSRRRAGPGAGSRSVRPGPRSCYRDAGLRRSIGIPACAGAGDEVRFEAQGRGREGRESRVGHPVGGDSETLADRGPGSLARPSATPGRRPRRGARHDPRCPRRRCPRSVPRRASPRRREIATVRVQPATLDP